jgi:hypothetical protein
MATSRVLGLVTAAMLSGAVAAAAQQVSAPTNRDRRVITSEEIQAAQVNTAYQVVEKLRPEFLRRMNRQQSLGAGSLSRPSSFRGASQGAGNSGNAGQQDPAAADPGSYAQPDPPATAAVFVDGTDMGGVEELQQLQSNMVEEIRYLSGTDSQTKYGPRFASGVIEVTLKKH